MQKQHIPSTNNASPFVAAIWGQAFKEYNDKYLNTVTLGAGMPNYESEDIILRNSKKQLFISFPNELISELDVDKQRSFKTTDISFNGTSDFNELVEETGISNLNELIKKYRVKVAKGFISNTNGCYFNGRKYGVYKLNTFYRTEDSKEKPKVYIDLYETDYFTHKVFREIYKEISNIMSDVTLGNLHNFKAFTTSFAANILVITKKPDRRLLLTKRSTFVTEALNKTRYNITTLEALSETDIDQYSGEINIDMCVKRGLLEEIGIPDSYYKKYDGEIKYYDVYLEKKYFELAITCSVEFNTSFEESILGLSAKDKPLEIADIEQLKLNSKINDFINNNDFTPQGLYTLKSVLSRKSIFLNKMVLMKKDVNNSHKRNNASIS